MVISKKASRIANSNHSIRIRYGKLNGTNLHHTSRYKYKVSNYTDSQADPHKILADLDDRHKQNAMRNIKLNVVIVTLQIIHRAVTG